MRVVQRLFPRASPLPKDPRAATLPALEAQLSEERIAVIGLGYVGLPAALALARKYPTTGFDINEARVAELRAGRDATGEGEAVELKGLSIVFTSNPVE
ncbi:MAG: hypothetical protein KJO07_10115, partial [Deltaproteobacteria bacterium]|nr:hypothetical protein [Deltaproteobacteria bacterium]